MRSSQTIRTWAPSPTAHTDRADSLYEVEAQRFALKMRGRAQAHLIEASDGRWYVVKFSNNPQHRRVVINEWLGSALLRYLGIATPRTAKVYLSRDFLDANPEAYITAGERKLRVEPGWHFGSQFPGDPRTVAVYDYLPDALLADVLNNEDFLGALVVDKWLCNSDRRQAIFVPSPHRQFRRGFIAMMIDQGAVFDGEFWDFPDCPLQGLYDRPRVYSRITSLDDFRPWLERASSCPAGVVENAVAQLPAEWVRDEHDAIVRIVERLIKRRRRIPELLMDCRLAKPGLFANWRL